MPATSLRRTYGEGHLDVGLSRHRLFFMFGAMYFVQGVIQAYQLNFFKPHMDAEGIAIASPWSPPWPCCRS